MQTTQCELLPHIFTDFWADMQVIDLLQAAAAKVVHRESDLQSR